MALTAIHAGVVAATFWALLANAIVSTQVVEDGTLSSLIVSRAAAHLVNETDVRDVQPISFFIIAFFAATCYISLDVGFTLTSVFGPSNPPQDLHSIPLFVLTTIWPGA